MNLKIIIKNIIIFILLVLIQVILLSNISVSYLDISPHFYILFILLLPIDIPGWLLLISAFLLGFSVDVFLDTIAIHTFATVFIAFLRPIVINILSPRNGYEYGIKPGIAYLGFAWFLKYTLIMVSIHHISYLIIDVFTFKYFYMSMLKISLSIALSTTLIIISQFLIFKNKK